jgi:hypothetical protein
MALSLRKYHIKAALVYSRLNKSLLPGLLQKSVTFAQALAVLRPTGAD